MYTKWETLVTTCTARKEGNIVRRGARAIALQTSLTLYMVFTRYNRAGPFLNIYTYGYNYTKSLSFSL